MRDILILCIGVILTFSFVPLAVYDKFPFDRHIPTIVLYLSLWGYILIPSFFISAPAFNRIAFKIQEEETQACLDRRWIPSIYDIIGEE